MDIFAGFPGSVATMQALNFMEIEKWTKKALLVKQLDLFDIVDVEAVKAKCHTCPGYPILPSTFIKLLYTETLP